MANLAGSLALCSFWLVPLFPRGKEKRLGQGGEQVELAAVQKRVWGKEEH